MNIYIYNSKRCSHKYQKKPKDPWYGCEIDLQKWICSPKKDPLSLSKFGDLETHPTAQLVKSQLFGIQIGTGLCSTGTGLFRERLAQLAMAQW
jgi:hypothetical protein